MRRRPSLLMAFWEQAELFPLYLYYANLDKRINSIAILAAARIPVQMEFLVATGICGSGRSPAAAEPGFQPRVSPV